MAQNIKFPSVTATLVADEPNVIVESKRTLLIGQMLSGTATAGVLTPEIGVNNEDALFGAKSQLASMVRSFRSINEVSIIDVIALDDDGGATASTGTITFTGTITTAGTITVYVGSLDRVVTIDVAVGDTATEIGVALDAALDLDTKSLITPSNAAGVVTLTANNGGTVANSIGILVELGDTAGVTVALVAMSGGATDPAMTGLSALITERTDVVMPIEYGTSTFVTLMDDRFNFDNSILDGRVFTSAVDTQSNLSTVGDAENSQSYVIIGDKPVSSTLKEGSAIFNMPYEKAAQFAAVRALRLEDDEVIADYMTTRNPADQIGGTHTSSLPYANTGTSLSVIPTGEGFTDAEVALLKASGISLLGNNGANNLIISGEILSTYKTNTAGQTDTTYKYLNSVDTATAAREFIFNSLKSDYAQRRLTNGSAVPGLDMATIGGVRASMSDYYLTLTSASYGLLQGGIIESGRNVGKSILSLFKDNLTVVFDLASGTINITSILPLVGQVRSIVVPLSIKFDVNAL